MCKVLDAYKIIYQHELGSFSELRKSSAPQLSAGPLGRINMELTAYNIVENSQSKFSIQYKRSIFSGYALSIIGIASGLLLFLVSNGFKLINLLVTFLLLPVVMIVVVLVQGFVPFSISVEPNQIIIIRKLFATIPRFAIYGKSSIKSLNLSITKINLYYNGIIEIVDQSDKRSVIFNAMDIKLNEVRFQIEFVASEIAKILVVPINKDDL